MPVLAYTYPPLGIHEDTTWTKDGSPYVIDGTLQIDYGITLTLDPGVHIKIGSLSGNINIMGTLHSGSVEGEEVVFTSIKDDSVDGDTNSDGMSTLPATGDWKMPIKFFEGSSGFFNNTIVRYGGHEYCNGGCDQTPMIENEGGTLVISKSTISDASYVAVLQGSGSLVISDTDFTRVYYALRITGGSVTVNHSNLDAYVGIANASSEVIDATNNWWGDASGPKDINIGNSNSASGSWIWGEGVSHVPWISEKLVVGAGSMQDPVLTPCQVKCFSNVLFLPGFEASRLYEDEDKLWEPPSFLSDSHISRLFLNSEGESISSKIKTRDVIDEALVPVAGPNIYKSFIEDMNTLKTDGIINDWEQIPYDWRFSPEDILKRGEKEGDFISYLSTTPSPYILQEVEQLAANSKTGKISIVAHSNGGLLTKALMKILEQKNETHLIDKIIFIAVPQIGAPQAIGSLLHGFGEGLALFFSAGTMRTFGQNMPSAYNLLPSYLFQSPTGLPFIIFDATSSTPWMQKMRDMYGTVINSPATLFNFLEGKDGRGQVSPSDLRQPSILNPSLLARSNIFHRSIDDWYPQSGTKLYQIAGWGLDTVAGIRYYEGQARAQNTIFYRPLLGQDGDGTVPIKSAWAMATSSNVIDYWIDLKEANRGLKRNRGHADILEIPDLRNLIKSIVMEEPEVIHEPLPQLSQEEGEEVFRFFVHSINAEVNVYDSAGNHTGVSTSTGSIEIEIPESDYRQFGEVTYIKLPHRTGSKLARDAKMLITNNSDLSDEVFIEMENVIDGVIASSTSFGSLSLSTSTVLTIGLSATSTSIEVPSVSIPVDTRSKAEDIQAQSEVLSVKSEQAAGDVAAAVSKIHLIQKSRGATLAPSIKTDTFMLAPNESPRVSNQKLSVVPRIADDFTVPAYTFISIDSHSQVRSEIKSDQVASAYLSLSKIKSRVMQIFKGIVSFVRQRLF